MMKASTWRRNCGCALGLALAAIGAPAVAQKAGGDLRITLVDVEGGAASLYLTPQGHSLLIDTGWVAGAGGPRPAPGSPPPPATPSSAQRIAAAMKTLGLTRLDYLLVSHYHADHVGGADELMSLVPVGTLIDHGENRETPRAGAPAPSPYDKYRAATATRKHIVMHAGQVLTIDGLKLTAVDSDRQIITRPLGGGIAPVAACAALTAKSEIGGEENPRSLGLLLEWRKTRILSLADTTWDVENQLVCPRNLIGKVDLMFADNHGTNISNSPALLASVRPTVMLFNNGPIKGADGEVLDRARAVPGIQAIWQVHYATRSPAANAPADQIANLDTADAMYPLTVRVGANGAFTVVNPRNGIERSYRRAAR